RKCVVIKTPSGAHDGFTMASNIVGDAYPWGEIIPVLRVQLVHLLRRSYRGIEDAKPAAFLTNHTKVIPAQTGIDRQVATEFYIVLQIEPMIILESAAPRVAGGLVVGRGEIARGQSGEEICE